MKQIQKLAISPTPFCPAPSPGTMQSDQDGVGVGEAPHRSMDCPCCRLAVSRLVLLGNGRLQCVWAEHVFHVEHDGQKTILVLERALNKSHKQGSRFVVEDCA